MLYVHMQRYDDALNTITLAITRGAQHVNAWLDYTRILVRLHRIEEAFEACKKTLKLAPQNDTCKFNHRLISRLVETTKPTAAHTISIITLTPRTPKHECVEYVQQHDATRWVDAIFNASSRWIMFEDGSATKEKEALQLLECSGFEWAACVTDSRTPQLTLWRRDFLISLLHTGSIGLHAPLSRLLALAKTYGRTSTNHPNTALDMRAWKANGRTVLLFSQYGIRKFGGGEHFLQQMAHIYKAMGFDVLVIGTQAEFVGEEGEVNGLRYRFIDRSPEEFIRLVFDEKAVLCHMISGLAFEVTNALRYFNISIIHGIHFWRDMMAPPTPSTGYYPDVDVVETQGRLEFNGVIRDSEVVYANSLYTRKEVERLYGMCAPIIYSLPDPAPEEAQGKVTATGRDYVLLANARVDKGYDIFIKTAQLLPHIRFCAIASQSSRALAQSMLDVAGVTNVELLDHVSDMTTLYKEARVVAVPSYKFIETFSRVVIEAQRFGVPVIGSDRGNVPYLLIESGISLPEDAALWAKEIEQLFADDAYWQKRSRMALENSERYSFDMQHVRLSNIVSAVEKPVLVGVGSGLGNIIHTAPVIRNIALRTGRPVDVVMAGDHTDMLFVLANRNYVNHVFVLNEDVMNRRYEAVFLTHSFGTAIPKFSTNRLLISRNWRDFHPGNELHEAEFNLAAAKQLLGVDYAPEDVNSYFLGDYVYERPAEVFVGLHAGSKGGIWGAKRWPHYDVLAKRLMAAGIRVASFGTPDEYVVGTENRTGGTIEQMTRAMLSCSHFVSNDSGVMNIANALGIPLVALFAPTNIFTRGPLAPTSQAIAIEKDCSPCELDRKPDSRFNTATCDCIKEINVQDVTKALGLTA